MVLGMQLLACGGGTSTDERWDADVQSASPNMPWPVEAGTEVSRDDTRRCRARPIAGYHYAEPPEFWLGWQGDTALRVDGPGFLVSEDAVRLDRAERFSTQVLFSVGPDGTLEDAGGHRLLGYGPEQIVGGRCLVSLRAPAVAAPRATASVSIRINLDPRSLAVEFDLVDPSASSSSALSFEVFDSVGASRRVDVYFAAAGGNGYAYYVLADGSDIQGGTPGVGVLLSAPGFLQFTTDGALHAATTPQVCVSFTGATPEQCLAFDFGLDIASGGSGLSGSTGFAEDTSVSALDRDGHATGTAGSAQVAPSGEVTVNYDNGKSLLIGTLALARFANEDGLVDGGEASFRATVSSGPPQYGAPLKPGRGQVTTPAP